MKPPDGERPPSWPPSAPSTVRPCASLVPPDSPLSQHQHAPRSHIGPQKGGRGITKGDSVCVLFGVTMSPRTQHCRREAPQPPPVFPGRPPRATAATTTTPQLSHGCGNNTPSPELAGGASPYGEDVGALRGGALHSWLAIKSRVCDPPSALRKAAPALYSPFAPFSFLFSACEQPRRMP